MKDEDIDFEEKEDEYKFTIKVPKDRIAVFIGKEGETKETLTSELDCELEVDSEDGEITAKADDSLKLLVAKDVLKAIARGFNPKIALKLIKNDFFFEMINLNDYEVHKKHQHRLKGRVIGRNGKARSLIEEYTGCYVSVYGKTVCIIGKGSHIMSAKKAIDSILGGSPHAYVYKWLEKEKTNLSKDDI
ncbi:MAG: KH domain-containing protein [Nanobdellota archaeon]